MPAARHVCFEQFGGPCNLRRNRLCVSEATKGGEGAESLFLLEVKRGCVGTSPWRQTLQRRGALEPQVLEQRHVLHVRLGDDGTCRDAKCLEKTEVNFVKVDVEGECRVVRFDKPRDDDGSDILPTAVRGANLEGGPGGYMIDQDLLGLGDLHFFDEFPERLPLGCRPPPCCCRRELPQFLLRLHVLESQ